MNITEHFIIGNNNRVELSFVPKSPSLNVSIDGVNQVDGIDYIVECSTGIYVFDNSFIGKSIDVDYEYDEPMIGALAVGEGRPEYADTSGPDAVQGDFQEYKPFTVTSTLDEIAKIVNPGARLSPSYASIGAAPPSIDNYRPPLPSTLCEFLLSETFIREGQRPPIADTLQDGDELQSLVDRQSITYYPPDQCIREVGIPGLNIYNQPGDLLYAACSDEKYGQPEDLYDVDWTAAFAAEAEGSGDSGSSNVNCKSVNCWAFLRKQYVENGKTEDSWRIRIGTDVTKNNSLGSGSDVRAGGRKLGWYGYDKDCGAYRASYTAPGSTNFSFPVTVTAGGVSKTFSGAGWKCT